MGVVHRDERYWRQKQGLELMYRDYRLSKIIVLFLIKSRDQIEYQ